MARSPFPRPDLVVLGAIWILACAPPTPNVDGRETGGGTNCTTDDPVLEVVVSGEEGVSSDCVISMVEQLPTSWLIAADCEGDSRSIELELAPPLDEASLEVGEAVHWMQLDASEGHYVALTVDGALRLFTVDLRVSGPGPDTMFDQPLFPPGVISFAWSTIPGCTAVDSLCGVVDAKGAEVSMYTTLDGQVVSLGPDQTYGEISEAALRFGVWLGPNWISDCHGETMSRVSYTIVALPL